MVTGMPKQSTIRGDKVIVNGVTYEAQWWTQGENPTQSG